MINVMLTGVGGQGTVLASKILARAAQDKGWHVRTAETIGMAQRGGSVVSHVRMGNFGEEVYSPLIWKRMADMIIAFEPAEGARMLPYLSPKGMLVSATTGIPSVTSALGDNPYNGSQAIMALEDAFAKSPERLAVIPEAELLEKAGSKRALNTVMLASAISSDFLPITLDDLRDAVKACVKPAYVGLNLNAIDIATDRSTSKCR